MSEQLKIIVDNNGRTKVLENGIDITAQTRRISFSAGADEIPEVKIEKILIKNDKS